MARLGSSDRRTSFLNAVGYGITEPYDQDAAGTSPIYDLTGTSDGFLDVVHAELWLQRDGVALRAIAGSP